MSLTPFVFTHVWSPCLLISRIYAPFHSRLLRSPLYNDPQLQMHFAFSGSSSKPTFLLLLIDSTERSRSLFEERERQRFSADVDKTLQICRKQLPSATAFRVRRQRQSNIIGNYDTLRLTLGLGFNLYNEASNSSKRCAGAKLSIFSV